MAKKLKIKVTHPGILRVPAGKSVTQLPASHFLKIARRRGHAAVSRALTNLERWNKNRKPSLSRWARSMKNKVRHALGKSGLKVHRGGKRRHRKIAARSRRLT